MELAATGTATRRRSSRQCCQWQIKRAAAILWVSPLPLLFRLWACLWLFAVAVTAAVIVMSCRVICN